MENLKSDKAPLFWTGFVIIFVIINISASFYCGEYIYKKNTEKYVARIEKLESKYEQTKEVINIVSSFNNFLKNSQIWSKSLNKLKNRFRRDLEETDNTRALGVELMKLSQR